MKVDTNLSSTLLVANSIAMILIVLIHYNSFLYIDIANGYDLNFIFQQFWLNGVARIAVPIFAFMSGFFLVSSIGRNIDFFGFLRNKSRTLLLPYVLSCTLIYIGDSFFVYFLEQVNRFDFGLLYFIENALFKPSSVQLWFLRDLLFLLPIAYVVVVFFRKFIPLIIFVFLFLWFFEFQLFPIFYGYYFVSTEVVLFLFVGVFFSRLNWFRFIKDVSPANVFYCGCFFALLLIFRIFLYPDFDVWYSKDFSSLSLFIYKISILVGCVFLLLISNFLNNNIFLLYFSSFSFFVYLFHLVPISYFKYATSAIFSKQLGFYYNAPIAFFMVFSIGVLLSYFMPKLYLILTGGRAPLKNTIR